MAFCPHTVLSSPWPSRLRRAAGEKALAEHVGLCLFAAFWYMHIYPTVDAISGWEFGKRATGRRFSKTKFYACVLPVIMELAQIIDEIDYEDRLHPANHGTGRDHVSQIHCLN